MYVTVGNDVFRQVIGIPMGTDCAPFLANLYLYALEFEFLEKLTKQDMRENFLKHLDTSMISVCLILMD